MLIYLALGSNIGDRVKYLENAKKQLVSHGAIQIVSESIIYETEHWPKLASISGHPEQWEEPKDHLNQVILAETQMTPRQLLSLIKKIEHDLGREKRRRWGSREIDIDILLYGDQKLNEPDLTIPHPRMQERQFVLIPLVEIAPDLTDPISKRRYSDILGELRKVDDHEVRLLG